MKQHSGSLIAGLALIAFGVWLLLDDWFHFHIVIDKYFLRSWGLLIVGALAFGRAVAIRPRTTFYLPTLLFLGGLIYLLVDNGLIPPFQEMIVSCWVLAAGLAFIPGSLMGTGTWRGLLAGGLVSALGGILIFYSLGFIESLRFLDIYWPVAIILVGVAYLIYGMVSRRGGSVQSS